MKEIRPDSAGVRGGGTPARKSFNPDSIPAAVRITDLNFFPTSDTRVSEAITPTYTGELGQ